MTEAVAAQPQTQESSRLLVRLGNPNPLVQVPVLHPETREQIGWRGVPHPFIRQSTTVIEHYEGINNPDFVALTASTENDRIFSMIHRSLAEEHKDYAVGVHEIEQLWPTHCGSGKPDWVWSNDPKYAEALAAHFGCPAVPQEPTMLLTTNGRDSLHNQHLTTGAQPAAFNYMALTANATAPAAGDTTLTGEITTAGGGLLRAQATYAHTNGTNTSTLTKTFTANGSDSLPVTIAKIGVFNATSAGTMGYETLLNATATLSVSGDNTTVTDTLTGG